MFMSTVFGTDSGSRAVDEQFPKIDIPPFAQAQQTGLAARGVFAWYKAQPGRQLAAVFEVGGIRHGRQYGGGRQRPDARNGLHLLTHRMRSSERLKLLVIVSHPFLEGEKLIIEVPEHLCAQRGELGLCVLELTYDRGAKLGHALGEDHAILAQKSADLMDQRGAGFDEALPHPMQGLEILLLQLFDRHKPHGGPRHRFTDCFGIAGIVLR
jgi:hypothetical protein